MAFVWNESLKQASEMLQSWTGRTKDGIPSVAKDTRTLSLNVLAATGFKKSYSFRSSTQSGADEAHTYRDALQSVLDNAIFLMLVPPRVLLLPLLPASWVRVGKAAAAFKQHMKAMLEEETSSFERGEPGTGGLMTSFVRALDTYRKDESAPRSNEHSLAKGLTVDEIFGNIFVINFAGHDTTANTLAFSMLLLAANPEIQEWVAKELRQCVTNLDSKAWDYNELFPKLKRCQAILVCPPNMTTTFLKLMITCAVRDSPPLSTHPRTPQMDKRAPANPSRRRKNPRNPPAHRNITKSACNPNAPQILA